MSHIVEIETKMHDPMAISTTERVLEKGALNTATPRLDKAAWAAIAVLRRSWSNGTNPLGE